MSKHNTIFLLVAFLPAHLFSQGLQWSSDDIATDLRQSGGSPDLYQSASGDLRLSYWNAEEDHLSLASKTHLSGIWQISTPGLSVENHGYKSALTEDDNGNIHLAYLAESPQGFAVLRYATNTNGQWTIEAPLGEEDLGPYGIDVSDPGFIQASIDIELTNDGRPIISVFDGSIQTLGTCTFINGPFYVDYDLQVRVTGKDSSGQWIEVLLEDIPVKRHPECLPQGDRFGEFCTMEKREDGTMYLLVNSTHNHELLLFYSDGTDYTTWAHQVLDSVDTTLPGAARFLDTFEDPQLELASDSSLFVFSAGSSRYGFDGSTNRYLMTFIKFTPASDSSLTYTKENQINYGQSNNYRSHLSFIAKNQDTLYQTYLEILTSTLWIQYSFNGGLSWQKDSVDQISTNANCVSAITSDSLIVVAYDQFKQSLTEYAFPLSATSHTTRTITVTESRGRYISSVVSREPGGDIAAVVYPEDFSSSLLFSSNESGTWVEELISDAAPSSAALTRTASGSYLAVFSDADAGMTYQGEKGSGTWSVSPITQDCFQQFQLVSDADSIYGIGIRKTDGALVLMTRELPPSAWRLSVLDTSSAPYTSLSPIRLVNGELHFTLANLLSNQVFYVTRPQNGQWNFTAVTQPQSYAPLSLDIGLFSTGEPVITFKDGKSSDIFIAEFRAGQFELSKVPSIAGNFVGLPLKLLIDSKDKPWILYNYADFGNDMKLIRRDASGTWFGVGISGNSIEISDVFDFHLVEDDLYIFGKKNEMGNRGIGVLFAQNGIRTLIETPIDFLDLSLFPNPSDGVLHLKYVLEQPSPVTIQLYNLTGEKVYHKELFRSAGYQEEELKLSVLGSGHYMLTLSTGESISTRKLLLRN